MSTENKTEPSSTETLFGGSDAVVTKRDKSTEAVFIAQLSVDRYPDLLRAQDDECAMIELYCGKPAGWAKTLTPESLEFAISEGERMNADFFARWVQRRIARQERLIPGVTAKMTERALSASQTSAPKSPPSAA